MTLPIATDEIFGEMSSNLNRGGRLLDTTFVSDRGNHTRSPGHAQRISIDAASPATGRPV
jgi:hypothetical protein